MSTTTWTRIGILAALGVVVPTLLCCEARQDAEVTTYEPEPVARAPQPAPRGAERAERPDTPTEPAAVEQEAEAEQPEIEVDETEDERPQQPPFVAVSERTDASKPYELDVQVEEPRRLRINTRNVTKLRLTRDELPLSRQTSIILLLDDQGIEWTPEFTAIELERSSYGDWSVVKRRPANP